MGELRPYAHTTNDRKVEQMLQRSKGTYVGLCPLRSRCRCCVLSRALIPPSHSSSCSLHQTPAPQSSPPHRQRAVICTFADDDMCGILCAVPRVGAALRFDGDGDAEIENVDDDDRPRGLPWRRQSKSGQPVSPRTDEPSFKRRGLCFSLAKGAGVVPAERLPGPLRRFDERAKRRRCPLRRRHLLSAFTPDNKPKRRADAAVLSRYMRRFVSRRIRCRCFVLCCSPSHTCSVFAVLSSSERPSQPTTNRQKAAHLPSHPPRQALSYTDPPTICSILLGVLCVVV
jgi:hypothetical protein